MIFNILHQSKNKPGMSTGAALLVAPAVLLWLQINNESWMWKKADCDDKNQNIFLVICEKNIFRNR
jgi:hypothetical protein